ncbi:MAG TPA: RIO1 family regulatory kinase/ATPase [Candidatus Caenarcaniphilales bacterium]|nr:RIO1 family regulatory kinase/ATPase [Candidatus Caenarcaniphilales bacterium]
MPATGTRPVPSWLIQDSFEDIQAGVLKSGKEAEVFLVERRSPAGSCLLAHKRYRPRYPGKGELRELGFSKGTIYRADSVYREGWHLKRRERLAVEGGSRFGHELSASLWPHNEMQMLQRAWQAGASVPYPVDRTPDGLLMEFIGGRSAAAPPLVNAHLDAATAAGAWQQLAASLRALTSAGVVHGDLSAYNVLWWRGRLVVIDFPQAIDATTNVHAPELLRRDVANVASWFQRQRVDIDPERFYLELLELLFAG